MRPFVVRIDELEERMDFAGGGLDREEVDAADEDETEGERHRFALRTLWLV